MRGYTGAQVARWLARWLAGCGWLSCLSWLWLAEVKVSAFDMWMRLMRRMALLAGCGGWVAGWLGRRLAGWLAGWLGLGRGWPGGFMWLHYMRLNTQNTLMTKRVHGRCEDDFF